MTSDGFIAAEAPTDYSRASLLIQGSLTTNLSRAARLLRAVSDAAQLEAELLLGEVLACSRADLYAQATRSLSAQQCERYQSLIIRRISGVPLSYLTGRKEFYGLDFVVDQRVLIPRQETETLVDFALEHLAARFNTPPGALFADSVSRQPVVVDVGTGSGCIAISIAVHAPQVQVIAVDACRQALNVASTNALRHGISDRITFLHGDLLSAVPGPVDLIVGNLPYVATADWSRLSPQIRDHEPRQALVGGADGLDVIRRLLFQAPLLLRAKGSLLLEIGADQGAAVAEIARTAFQKARVLIHPDLGGLDRVVSVTDP